MTKDLLLKVKNFYTYEKNISIYNIQRYGLCHVAEILYYVGTIDGEEEEALSEYFFEIIHSNGEGYNKQGQLVDSSIGCYIFPVGAVEPRVELLDKLIAEL